MGWQLEGEDHVLAWLNTSPDPHAADLVLAWIGRLVADPPAVEGNALPGSRVGKAVANVPGTDVWITWLTVHQYRG